MYWTTSAEYSKLYNCLRYRQYAAINIHAIACVGKTLSLVSTQLYIQSLPPMSSQASAQDGIVS